MVIYKLQIVFIYLLIIFYIYYSYKIFINLYIINYKSNSKLNQNQKRILYIIISQKMNNNQI